MKAAALITVRDRIRLLALESLAVNFVETLGDSVYISGSYAISLHTGHGTRLPNDLDLVTPDPHLLPIFVRECERLSTVEFSAERVELFSGEIDSIESLVAVPDIDGSNNVLDIVSCQLTVVGQDEVGDCIMSLGGIAVPVVELPRLLANKLHALWKVRTSGMISSRVRDLFDLAQLSAAGEHEKDIEAGAEIAARIGRPRTPLGSFPREWIPAWRDLNRAGGTAFSIDEAWVKLERIAQEA